MFAQQPAPEDLSSLVQCYWGLRLPAAQGVQRIIPDGQCELLLHLGARCARLEATGEFRQQPEAFVFGQLQRAIQIRSEGASDLFAVRFRAHGVAGIFGLNAAALGAVEVETVAIGLRGLELERLRDCDFAGRCFWMSQWLRRQLRPRPQQSLVQAALGLLDRADPQQPKDMLQLARELGVGRRRLERLLLHEVGLAPMLWSRLRRLQRCARQLADPAQSLATIALAAGFADQAHFSRQFHAVVGLSPGAYRKELLTSEQLIS